MHGKQIVGKIDSQKAMVKDVLYLAVNGLDFATQSSHFCYQPASGNFALRRVGVGMYLSFVCVKGTHGIRRHHCGRCRDLVCCLK